MDILVATSTKHVLDSAAFDDRVPVDDRGELGKVVVDDVEAELPERPCVERKIDDSRATVQREDGTVHLARGNNRHEREPAGEVR